MKPINLTPSPVGVSSTVRARVTSIKRASLALVIIATSTSLSHAGSRSWSIGGGDPSKAAYSVGATVSGNATTSAYSGSANAYADVAFLNSSWYRIASGSASLNGTKTTLGICSRLDFVGANIYNYSQSWNALNHTANSGWLSRSFSPPVSPFFFVGPVKVTVKPSVSVALTTSSNLAYNTSVQTLTASLNPASFDLAGTVSASVVGGLVAVSGNLTLCRITPVESSACDWKNRRLSNSATINYSTLGGSIDLRAGWTYLNYSANLMSWNGYSSTQTLLSESVPF